MKGKLLHTDLASVDILAQHQKKKVSWPQSLCACASVHMTVTCDSVHMTVTCVSVHMAVT